MYRLIENGRSDRKTLILLAEKTIAARRLSGQYKREQDSVLPARPDHGEPTSTTPCRPPRPSDRRPTGGRTAGSGIGPALRGPARRRFVRGPGAAARPDGVARLRARPERPAC